MMFNTERRATLSVASIMAFRMLGLFMVLPVFSVHAVEFSGATAFLIGLALGIYGLTQACLQIPFGMLSDRIGRKPVIIGGLLLFALGSIIAALSHSIYGVIIGRAIQGAGAVGSTLLALVADLTRDENRSKAMAMIGLSIGAAFSVAMVVGPIINAWWHLAGVFWVTAGLAFLSILLFVTTIPQPPKLYVHQDVGTQPQKLLSILKNPQLRRLNIGIFCLHAMLTALFIAIPMLLTHVLDLHQSQQILLYVTVIITSFILMIPFIIIAEKKHKLKLFFIGSIVALIITQVLLITFHYSALSVSLLLLLFFTAFTLLEASLPSLVSKFAPIRSKGTAMGIYSSSQFLGIFIGGSLGGLVFEHVGIIGIFGLCAFIGLAWLIYAITMQQPPYLSTMILELKQSFTSNYSELNQCLQAQPGIAEFAVLPDEGIAYLKINQKIINKHELRKLFETGNLAQ